MIERKFQRAAALGDWMLRRTMRVEMVVEAPDDEGYSHVRMTRFKRVNGAREPEPDHEIETYIALEGTRTDRYYRSANHPSLQSRADYAARMRAALAQGEPWVGQPGGAALTPALVRELGVKTRRFGGRIAILTDEACFSTSLDFVDTLLLAPGTVHLGRTTGAHTRHMDVGTYRIGPQLLVQSPFKVWLGRPRGNNEPHVPSRVFAGDIVDDMAVRAWVLSAMESKATP